MDPFLELVSALNRRMVRCVLIGVAGANYHALGGSTLFATEDRDLFLPLDPTNELRAWDSCLDCGLELWCGDERLGSPRDEWLAERVVARRALVRATDGAGLDVDLTLVMGGFEFEAVWSAKRTFVVEDVPVPVARLRHIVESKAAAGRQKDRLFLATHEEALRQLGKLDADRS